MKRLTWPYFDSFRASKIQDQPEVVALQTAAAIVCGAGQKYGIYYSCKAAVNVITVALCDILLCEAALAQRD